MNWQTNMCGDVERRDEFATLCNQLIHFSTDTKFTTLMLMLDPIGLNLFLLYLLSSSIIWNMGDVLS